MNRPFEVFEAKEKIALRSVLFAIELLDAVTLDHVSQGVEVKAYGLQGKPIVNSSGLFVWLEEDIEQLQKVLINPGVLPYEAIERNRSQLNLELDSAQGKWPLTSIELSPRLDYPFGSGVTGLRGTLVEAHDNSSRPVPNAEVYLSWLDQDGNWHDAPTKSHTTAMNTMTQGGDFVAILRLAPKEEPQLDADQLTVRLRVKRDDDERNSGELKLLQGRVASPSTPNRFVFAWDELEP
jgi:hypothetical protein